LCNNEYLYADLVCIELPPETYRCVDKTLHGINRNNNTRRIRVEPDRNSKLEFVIIISHVKWNYGFKRITDNVENRGMSHAAKAASDDRGNSVGFTEINIAMY